MTTYYLDPEGTDSGSGPWATLAYALSHMAASDTLVVRPGTYAGAQDVSPPSGTSEAPTTIHGIGRPVIDGSGLSRCLRLWGVSYVTVEGLDFQNEQGAPVGWSITEGVSIADLNNTPGVGRSSHHIIIEDCRFLRFTRRDGSTFRGAASLLVYSYANEANVGEEGCHHVEVRGCKFFTNKSNMLDGNGDPVFAISSLILTANVRDWVIEDCTFYHDMALFLEGNGAIETVSNYSQNPGAGITPYPDQVRQGVIRRNQFIYSGPTAAEVGGGNYDARYAIYTPGAADLLIEGNIIQGWGYGIGLVCEDGTVHNTLERITVRRNVIVDCQYYAIVAGTWSAGYLPPRDLSIVHNTITASQSNVFGLLTFIRNNLSEPAVEGDVHFRNNLLSVPDRLVYSNFDLDGVLTIEDNVMACSGSVMVGTTLDVPSGNWEIDEEVEPAMVKRRKSYGVERVPAMDPPLPERAPVLTTPTWYVACGDYDDGTELDFAGDEIANPNYPTFGAIQSTERPVSIQELIRG